MISHKVLGAAINGYRKLLASLFFFRVALENYLAIKRGRECAEK